MAIMELRRPSESALSLNALREFSRRLKVWVLIGREVWDMSGVCASGATGLPAWRDVSGTGEEATRNLRERPGAIRE
jgi:hypothetical protein